MEVVYDSKGALRARLRKQKENSSFSPTSVILRQDSRYLAISDGGRNINEVRNRSQISQRDPSSSICPKNAKLCMS